MSSRSILLATTMCVTIASVASIDAASAHGGGGGGFGGGGFHSFGGGFHSVSPVSMPRAPVNAPPQVRAPRFGHAFQVIRSVAAPTTRAAVPNPVHNNIGNLSAGSVALPKPISFGQAVGFPHSDIPVSGNTGNPSNLGQGGKSSASGGIPVAGNTGNPSNLGQGGKPSAGGGIPVAGNAGNPLNPGQGKPSGGGGIPITGNAGNPVNPVLGQGSQLPPQLPPGGPGTGGMGNQPAPAGMFSVAVPVVVGTDVVVDSGCYLVKRRFATPGGDVIGYAKVCEVIDTDQR
jgi:hypothetical protein